MTELSKNSVMKINQKKKGKVFFAKLILTISALYATFFLYIEFFPNYYNTVNNTRWRITKKILSKEIDISDTTVNFLFIGDSRVNAGIDLLKIPNSWSFASGGSTPVEMYFILEKYLQNYPKPDTIFFSISPRLLQKTLIFWDYAVRNDFITYNDFAEIEKHRQTADVIELCPKGKFLLYKLNYIRYYQSDIFTNRVFFAKEKNEQMLTWVLTHNGQRLHEGLRDSCSELNYETKFSNFSPPPLFDFYFNKIFETCQKEGIYIFFDVMPMNYSSSKKLNVNFIAEYKDYINSYQNKYPDFLFSDTLIFYPDKYFGDESHLNVKGQKKYTEYFFNLYLNTTN